MNGKNKTNEKVESSGYDELWLGKRGEKAAGNKI